MDLPALLAAVGRTLWAFVPTSAGFWIGFALFWLALTVVQTGWVVMHRRSPVATLGWIVALMLLPFVGLLLYRFFGPMRIQRQRMRRLRARAFLGAYRDRLRMRARHGELPRQALQHARLIEESCGLPLSSAHRIELLRNGVATRVSMLEAIAAARDHIHLEYYIYEPDRMGTMLRDALVAKLREGVKVRLLIDALGSPKVARRRGRRAFFGEFMALGGEIAVFHPVRFARLRPLVNLRTHRKILIVDGRVGFTGGINITEDENEDFRPDHAWFRDTHVRVEGRVVRWLQLVFLEDWAYAVGERSLRQLSPELIVEQEPAPRAAQVVASGPDSEGESIHRSIIDALHTAQHRVWLTTPYFVPTEAVLYALTGTARRGIDVKLLVPRTSDNPVVTWAARSYFDELQAAGIKVFEYVPRMLHAKTMLVDEGYAQIGTANTDHRSYRLNFEVSIVFYDEAINAQLADDFERDLADSKIVPKGRQHPFRERLALAVARLFSPIL
jgi:cardiolipin synthase A/B